MITTMAETVIPLERAIGHIRQILRAYISPGV